MVRGESLLHGFYVSLLWNDFFSPILAGFGKAYGDSWLLAFISGITEIANVSLGRIIAASVIFPALLLSQHSAGTVSFTGLFFI